MADEKPSEPPEEILERVRHALQGTGTDVRFVMPGQKESESEPEPEPPQPPEPPRQPPTPEEMERRRAFAAEVLGQHDTGR